MNILVTGGAGFIGSHLVDRLLDRGDKITVYDNLSSGSEGFIKDHLKAGRLKFIKNDLLDPAGVREAMKGQEAVFHLAANPDVRRSLKETRLDLEQGTIATYNVLEAIKLEGVKKIVFTSSSVVYGEPSVIPTPEDHGPVMPISLYGASKLACEGLISSYCHIFDMKGWIFRFANIIGSRATHGVVADFIEKLKDDPKVLEILGDGEQCKSFLLVEECVDAILFAVKASREQLSVFNLGSQDNIKISEIARILTDEMGLKGVKYKFTGGKRGWRGDVPLMLLGVDKLKALGWKTRYSSEESVRLGIRGILCKQ
ncbi:NAD-dependent epimerase/dehydratase family protein [Candidatus Omnitrophota bacterium]